MEPWQYIAGLVVTGLVTYAAARYTGRSAAKVGEEANAVTFSRDLIARIESLEADVAQLRTDLEANRKITATATSFIERLVSWVLTGCQGHRPVIPITIEPHLDDWLVNQYKREKTS